MRATSIHAGAGRLAMAGQRNFLGFPGSRSLGNQNSVNRAPRAAKVDLSVDDLPVAHGCDFTRGLLPTSAGAQP
jgi:hypothetical protein